MIRLNADVPDDFEEYCAIWFRDATDEKNRIDYVEDLDRAKRFKKFITQEEIRSIPLGIDRYDNKQNNEEEEEEIETIDLNDESNLKLLGYSFISLNDKREYDKLVDLHSNVEYYEKIVKSYGFDIYNGEFNEKMFPITKEDKQMENIEKDFKNYFKTLSEYNDYLKELIKKYDIKPTGNLVKRSL